MAVAVAQASGLAPLVGRVAAQNGDQQRTVIADRLNVRAGAGLGNSVIAVLSYGDTVSIAGGTTWADGYEWVEIAVWGTNIGGWVASRYLSDGAEPPQDRVRVSDGPLNVRASRPSAVRSTSLPPPGPTGRSSTPISSSQMGTRGSASSSTTTVSSGGWRWRSSNTSTLPERILQSPAHAEHRSVVHGST